MKVTQKLSSSDTLNGNAEEFPLKFSDCFNTEINKNSQTASLELVDLVTQFQRNRQESTMEQDRSVSLKRNITQRI